MCCTNKQESPLRIYFVHFVQISSQSLKMCNPSTLRKNTLLNNYTLKVQQESTNIYNVQVRVFCICLNESLYNGAPPGSDHCPMWQNVCIRNNMDDDEGDTLWSAIELSLERWRHTSTHPIPTWTRSPRRAIHSGLGPRQR